MTENLVNLEDPVLRLLKALFDVDEQTCFADSIYGTAVKPKPDANDLWFSINPLKDSRLDANVLKYRNFLLELDSVPLNQQIDLVRSRLPVTSIVFSGSKSYHFIISLQTPVDTEAEYRRIVRGLMETVPEADKSTKNPSRLSRLPNRIRPETGLFQDLVYVGDRIPLSALPTPKPYHEPKPEAADRVFVSSLLLEVLHIGVDQYISLHFSGRNQFFYWLGKRCSELGLSKSAKKASIDKFYARLQNKSGFSIREAYAAARVKF